jgi:hypothetical protein
MSSNPFTAHTRSPKIVVFSKLPWRADMRHLADGFGVS